jgi:hypothetical protein
MKSSYGDVGRYIIIRKLLQLFPPHDTKYNRHALDLGETQQRFYVRYVAYPWHDITLEMLWTGYISGSIYTGFTVQENSDRFGNCECGDNTTSPKSPRLLGESAIWCKSREHDLKVTYCICVRILFFYRLCVYSWSAKQQGTTSSVFYHSCHISPLSSARQTRSLVEDLDNTRLQMFRTTQ